MLDAVLAVCLVGLVPAYMVWRSRRRGQRPKGRTAGTLRTFALACGLLAMLGASWLLNARPASALGLAGPVSLAAEIGLAFAVVVLGGFAAAIVLQFRSSKTKAADAEEALADLPKTWGEAACFVPAIVLVCAAWELLYRGFLFWFLTPRLGLLGAILLSATAYALAHGYTGLRSFAASLGAALVFAVGYAVTQSLWWLILLHCGFPVLGSLASVYGGRTVTFEPNSFRQRPG